MHIKTWAECLDEAAQVCGSYPVYASINFEKFLLEDDAETSTVQKRVEKVNELAARIYAESVARYNLNCASWDMESNINERRRVAEFPIKLFN